jgi:hypothetical protein
MRTLALVALLGAGCCGAHADAPTEPDHLRHVASTRFGYLNEYRDEEHKVTCWIVTERISCLRDEVKP